MGSKEVVLFETDKAKGRVLYRLFAVSIFVGICLIWAYRVNYVPGSEEVAGRWIWFGMFGAELWFGFYWFITQALRWNRVYRRTFKDRLSLGYETNLPNIDIFVCTADPTVEPPLMVINTVLSVMAYEYPTEKLSVYLSDDAGSDLTFYALIEASDFAKLWIPYCKNYKVEPRSPKVYFRSASAPTGPSHAPDFASIKKMYEDMEHRIESAVNLGRIPEEISAEHRGFSQWDSYFAKQDHGSIVQILIDGRDIDAKDVEGCPMPTLVYLAREKRPDYFHNFKAGAMNALIRVSSEISNGPIILNVDCDMFSNNSYALRDALCFFMDEKKGHEIAFVQFPQNFENVTKNDMYSASLRLITEVEFHGLDGCGGPLYVGTGCFHRRETLCGKKFTEYKDEPKRVNKSLRDESKHDLEERLKTLASVTYEENTQWGNEMGLKYGSPVEDVITGLAIQCRGWKSMYFNPTRKAFLGIVPTTLVDTLVQHKRWSEGDFQLFLSKYCPLWFGHGKISLGLQLGYCGYCFWPFNSLPVIYYSMIPSLCLLKGISLFPQISSPWFLSFAYVIFASCAQSFVEFIFSGGTVLGWWNDQRIWLYKRISSYLFAFIDTILKLLGIFKFEFIISSKVSDEEISKRYEKEIMEFGATSPMFTVLSTLALLNLFCFVGLVKKLVLDTSSLVVFETLVLQILMCGVLVLINLPLYRGLFLRSDKGKMPGPVTAKSVTFAFLICILFTLLY